MRVRGSSARHRGGVVREEERVRIQCAREIVGRAPVFLGAVEGQLREREELVPVSPALHDGLAQGRNRPVRIVLVSFEQIVTPEHRARPVAHVGTRERALALLAVEVGGSDASHRAAEGRTPRRGTAARATRCEKPS